MKIIVILTLILSILSCSRSDDNSNSAISQVDCITNLASDASRVDANSIDIQILDWDKSFNSKDGIQSKVPMTDVVVQLDNNGVCVKSNTQGFVKFSALSNGQHDIHIFPPTGYKWISVYDIKPTELRIFYIQKLTSNLYTPNNKPISFVSIKGTIIGGVANSRYQIMLVSDTGSQFRGRISDPILNNRNNYAVNIKVPFVAGSRFSGRLIAYMYNTESAAGEMYLLDATALGTAKTYSTTVAEGNYSVDNELAFTSSKAISPILAINDIVVPDNMNITSLAINGYLDPTIQNQTKPFITLYSYDGLDKNFALPRIFSSADPFGFQDIRVYIIATSTNNFDRFWRYSQKYPKSSQPVSIVPVMIKLPTIIDDLIGETITWDSIPDNLNFQYMNINFQNNQEIISTWSLLLEPTATSVTLPTIPVGVVPILNSWTQYELNLQGSTGTEFPELFSVTSKTWQP